MRYKSHLGDGVLAEMKSDVVENLAKNMKREKKTKR